MDRTANLLGAFALLVADDLAERTARVAGRSGAAAAALAVLHQEPDQTIEALRRPLGLTQSAAVRLVDALVADGLAERRPGRDARSLAVRLTTAGRREARRVLAVRAQTLDAVLAGLDDAERRALTAVLEKALAGATRDADHGETVCRLCDLAECPLDRCPVEQACVDVT